MKRTLLLVLLFFIHVNFYAQKISQYVVSTAGNTFSSNSFNLDWTLGETFTDTYGNESIIFNQGFHQTFTDIKTRINQTEFSNITICPNPVISHFILTIPNTFSNKTICFLTDLQGRILFHRGLIDNATEFDISSLSSGFYMMIIKSEKSQNPYILKIIKK